MLASLRANSGLKTKILMLTRISWLPRFDLVSLRTLPLSLQFFERLLKVFLDPVVAREGGGCSRGQMKLRAIFVAWILMLASIVRAGPPFVTDDPEVPPVGGWEINIPFTLQRTPGTTDIQAPLFDLNYGLPNIQLEFDVPVAVVKDNLGTAAGLGDILLGIKWRFFEDKHLHIQLGTYPQVFAPTGDAKSGLGSGRPTYELPLLAEKSWDKWTFYGETEYWLQTAPGQRNYWFLGAVLQHDITDRLSLGLELFGNTQRQSGTRPDVAFNIGGSFKLTEHLNLLFTGGRDIYGDTKAMLYLGLQILTKKSDD
jgi:Putative MetA-pathway of phenol degradation